MPGISTRQPGQVAYQKLIITGLPRKSLRLTCLPSNVVRVKFGAASPTCRPTGAPDEVDVEEEAVGVEPGCSNPTAIIASNPTAATMSTLRITMVPLLRPKRAVKTSLWKSRCSL